MRVQRTMEEQLTRSLFFSSSLVPKLKSSPSAILDETVPSWLRPIATGISGSRPGLLDLDDIAIVDFPVCLRSEEVVKHHGRVSTTPPRPLATPRLCPGAGTFVSLSTSCDRLVYDVEFGRYLPECHGHFVQGRRTRKKEDPQQLESSSWNCDPSTDDSISRP